MTPLAQHIEAIVLISGDSVALAELRHTLDVTATELAQALTELSESLAGHGIGLVISATHVQLTTSQVVASFIEDFIGQPQQALSRAAAETLALIAYRGPISRLVIEGIRGVDSRRMIRQLVARGLIQREGNHETVPQYGVTELFLRQAGVALREELPDFDRLSVDESTV